MFFHLSIIIALNFETRASIMKLSIKYHVSMTYCGSYGVVIDILSLHINIILTFKQIAIANLNIF